MSAVGGVLLLMGLALVAAPVLVLRTSTRLRPYGDPTSATARQIRAWRISGGAVALLGALVLILTVLT